MILPEKFEEFVRPGPCSEKGCTNTAKWGLTVKVWAKGFPKVGHDPLDMIWSIKVCDDHRNTIDPKVFWHPEGMNMIRKAMAALNRAEPDFDTSEFDWQRLATLQ